MQEKTTPENRTGSEVPEETYQWRALNDIPSCVFVLSSEGTVVFANEVAQRIMGLEKYIGEPFGNYFSRCPNSANDRFYDVVLSGVRASDSRHHDRCLFVSDDGTRYAFFVTSSYLRQQNGDAYLVVTCTDVTAEEKTERQRHESIYLLIAAILYICSFMFIYAVWLYLGQPGYKSNLTRIIEAGGLILGFLAFRYTSFIPEDLGLGFGNIRDILRKDGLASAAIVAVFCILKLVCMRAAPALIKHPEAFFVPGWVSWQRFILYLFTALLQEFLSRGILQECMLHILRGEHRNVMAIGISAIMFASLHIAYGPFYMLGAAVLLGVFGFVYDRQRSVWGLALIHFSFGMSAMLLGLV